MADISPESDITLAAPRHLRSAFAATGKIDWSSAWPERESCAAVQQRFCERVRQELQTALRGRVPLSARPADEGGSPGFTQRVTTFAAELWRAENLRTGEQQLLIPRFAAGGEVASAGPAYYRSAAAALKQNWPQLEEAISGAAARWFQENIALVPAASGAEREGRDGFRPGDLSANFERRLKRLPADREQRAASTRSCRMELVTAGWSPAAAREAAGGRARQEASAAGTGWLDRPLRGILPVDMRRELALAKAAADKEQCGDQPPETAAAGPSAPLEELRFRSFAELAAWASRQDAAGRRR